MSTFRPKYLFYGYMEPLGIFKTFASCIRPVVARPSRVVPETIKLATLGFRG